MHKLTLLLTLLGPLSGCSAQSAPGKGGARMPEGYFYGTDKWFSKVFVQVTSGKAIADFVHVEKFPRSLYSDTLVYDAGTNTWTGKTATVVEKNGNYKITMRKGSSSITIKANEVYYKEEANRMKNAGYARGYYEQYVMSSANREAAQAKYKELEKQYNIPELATTLQHVDFVKEYDKFKTVLLKP